MKQPTLTTLNRIAYRIAFPPPQSLNGVRKASSKEWRLSTPTHIIIDVSDDSHFTRVMDGLAGIRSLVRAS